MAKCLVATSTLGNNSVMKRIDNSHNRKCEESMMMHPVDREDMYRKQEACVRRYHEDCCRIEQQQDDVKRKRLLFERIEDQISFDTRRVSDQLDDYVNPFSPMYIPSMIDMQSRIRFNQTQVEEYLTQQLESLARDERKLLDEYRQRERAYKNELRSLEARSQQ